MTNLVTNGLLGTTPLSATNDFPLSSLPKDLLLRVIGYLNVREQKVFKLVGRQMRQLVNEYPNYVWKKLFQERLPPCALRTTPQRWLENGKARTTYEESCRVLENLKKGNFHYTALDITLPDHTLCYFQAGYKYLYTCYTNGRVSIWEKKNTFQRALNIAETGSPIYNLESTEDYLTVASKDGQLAIWRKAPDDQLHWLQTEPVGYLTTIFFTDNLLFVQAGSDQPLHLWKRSKQGLFQIIQTIEHTQKLLFMDDFFAVWIKDVGIEVRSEDRLLTTIQAENSQFWVVGSFLCIYTADGLEIWRKCGEKVIKVAVLPIIKGISDVDIWGNYLCVQHYKDHILLLFEIFNKFNLARTLRKYTNYFLCNEVLFAVKNDGRTVDVWQKQGLFIRNVQILSLGGPLTDLILHHQTLFIILEHRIISMYKRHLNGLKFEPQKILRASVTKIEDLQFKGGCLIAQTAEGKVETWDFTVRDSL